MGYRKVAAYQCTGQPPVGGLAVARKARVAAARRQPSRPSRSARLHELVVLAKAPVGRQQQELRPDRDHATVRACGHVPDEADGAVVPVDVTRAEHAPAVAHPLVVGGPHARLERVVTADLERLGEVRAVGSPDLFDAAAARGGVGLVPLGDVALDEQIEVGCGGRHGHLLPPPHAAVHYPGGKGNTGPGCAVDRFHRAGMAAGGRELGEPGLRADYGPTYYAAFLVDPDGNNVEAVCTR